MPSVSANELSSRATSALACCRLCFNSAMRPSMRFSSSSSDARSNVKRCNTAARTVSCSRNTGKPSPNSSRLRNFSDAERVYSANRRVASSKAVLSRVASAVASRHATNKPAASSLRISTETILYFWAWRACRFKLLSWASSCAITSSRRARFCSAARNFNSAS